MKKTIFYVGFFMALLVCTMTVQAQNTNHLPDDADPPNWQMRNSGLIQSNYAIVSGTTNRAPAAIPEILSYTFEEAGATVTNDALSPPAGTATATFNGALSQGPPAICDAGSMQGTGNSSTVDFLDTGWDTNLGTSSWTIAFKTNSIAPSGTLFYIFGDTGAVGFRCFTNGVAGAGNWILRGPLTDITATGGASTSETTTVFVYDNSVPETRAYVDGVLVSTVAQGALNISGSNFTVGGYSSNTNLPAGGALDSFGFYNRALSPAEVADLTPCPSAAPPASDCAVDNPQPVPATGTGGFPCVGGPTTSEVTVADVGIIGAGPGEYVLDNVSLDITHTFDGDLDITLISPNGTTWDLSSDNGSLGDNYTGTIFMDGNPSITTGSAPFTGTFEAEQGLMNTGFAGDDVNGIWTLSICDDAGGDSGTLNDFCIEFVQNPDPNAPIMNCPADAIVDASPGECEASFGFATPTALDPNGGSVTVTQTMGAPSPGPYPVGVTVIEFTATNDEAPNETTTCQFTITVVDNQPGMITCPADITQTNDPGLCEAAVTVPQPTVDDNCPTNPAGFVNDYNGTDDASDVYPVGTTVVTWTYTDDGGNSVDCTMNVTVTDDEAPEVSCIGGPAPATGSATGPGGTIPDNDPTGLTTTLDITEDFDITDLNVNLDINHTWMGDLSVSLTAPDGTTVVQLIDRPGVPATAAGCNNLDPAINVDLDDEAALTIEDSCPEPFVGSFIPNEALSAFDGISTMGTWTLFITDSAFLDSGVLNSWTLDYTYNAPGSAPLEVFLDADGMAVVPSTAFVSSVTDNCGIASIEVVGGITIPNIDQCGDNMGGVIDGSAPTESVTTVAESGLIGADYTLENVEIDITHTFDGDLEIELVSPAGTALMLSDNNGGAGDNYIDTVFMDGGADINTGSAPFTGTFEAEGGTFAATFDGEDVNGDWTLRVTDTFAPADDGTLDSFCISFASVNPSAALFTCDDVGESTVDILVTDIGGNTAMCTATVTVIDNIDPILVCQDFTLELGPDGTAMLDPMDLIDMDNTIEACGLSVDAVSEDDFDCDDIGTPQTVTLFVSDPSGNLASCEATVTVVDRLAPEVTCPADMTIDPGANNQLYEVPDYFADGLASATDNCTDPVTVFAQDPAAGSFIGDGVYTVTLSATDEYGNVGTCTFELTIESVLGADDNTLDAGISLYPNPAQGQVILSNTSNILLEKATMFDVNGKLVNTVDLTDMTTEKTIDISKLASGVYIVQIESENASVVKRLIKE